MGRLAAKQAMESYGTTTYPVLRGSMNEPLWPDTFKGSIAHKDNIAIAAVTKDPSYAGIGIDIEAVSYTHLDVYKRQPLVLPDNPKELCYDTGMFAISFIMYSKRLR